MRARLLLVALWFATSAFKPGTRPEHRNAILISWDGAGGDHVRANLAAGKLPNLARLVGKGALVDLYVTGHGTDTKPGHAQMLTGYEPSVTGVYSNVKFGAIPRGYSIFERLHQTFGKNGLTTIMLTGKGPNLGSQSPDGGSPEPFFLVRPGITVWDGDQIRPARVVGDKAVRYVERYAKDRFFLFVHFPDVDVGGHYFGEDSPDYDRALAECDAWLGKIMAAVTEQGIAERTLVYVTADHGFDRATKRHSNAMLVFLATNDARVSQPGEQRDVTPTVLNAMGVDLGKLTPRLPGKVLSK